MIADAKKNFKDTSVQGYCGRATLVLHRKLKALGIRSVMFQHRSITQVHFFLKLRKHILDVTASQFGMPPICFLSEKTVDERWTWWRNPLYEMGVDRVIKETSWWEEPFQAV